MRRQKPFSPCSRSTSPRRAAAPAPAGAPDVSTGPRPLNALVPRAVSSLTTGGAAWPAAARGRSSEPPLAAPRVLPARPHPATPTDSFEALYAPAGALVAPTAFAVHFLELVRPLLYPDPSVNFT